MRFAQLVAVAIAAVLGGSWLPTVTKASPNTALLGSCLTDDWVKSMETKLGVDHTARDETTGRLLHPFLQPSTKHRRFWFTDPRTNNADTYNGCMHVDSKFYHTTRDADGNVVNVPNANGSFVLETHGWDTHYLSTFIFGILLNEQYGYDVAYLNTNDAYFNLTARMTSSYHGICAPVHTNVEMWYYDGTRAQIWGQYSNESYNAGGLGYLGRSGIFASKGLIDAGLAAVPHYSADFWRDYALSDGLINHINFTAFSQDTEFYPAASAERSKYCPDGTMGCRDGCQKTYACTQRELAGKECLVAILMQPNWDAGFIPAVFDNLDIPAYVCYLGYSGAINYALKAAAENTSALFYHWEPDTFHVENKGKFERIFFPKTDPVRLARSTGTFGENGYGNRTNNGVDVDFGFTRLTKYASKLVFENQPAGSLVSKFAVRDMDMFQLMENFLAFQKAGSANAHFDASCKWVRDNYDIWNVWMDRLPLCDLSTHVKYTVTGCGANETVREISFEWVQPNPDNSSQPFNCDGGLRALPQTIVTSRSCDWILEEPSRWKSWIRAQPKCDASFYNYTVSACTSSAKRDVTYAWLLPRQDDPTRPRDCDDDNGKIKPLASVQVDCEYMPSSAPAYMVMLVLMIIAIIIYIGAMWFVFYNRKQPIIKRSQYELLEIMLVGAIIMSIAAVLYGGEPSDFLCGARPVFASAGFTTIFGSLFVKSLRVYRVFMSKAMKRVSVTLARILKVLAIFYVVDIAIIAVWFIVDVPRPMLVTTPAVEFRGDVERIECHSDSFIFSALLIFWKAILLFMGGYLSFLIRGVSTDFQESTWIFGSVVVVLMGSFVLLPLAYLVEMAASVFFVFISAALLGCTFLVVVLMLLPKVKNLHAVSTSYQSGQSGQTVGSEKVRDSTTTKGGSATQAKNTGGDDDE